MPFPKDFIWGAAAASYQIEGAYNADGKGLSVWDMFCRKPGAVLQGDTGDTACDHYHHYKEDVGLMHQIGLKAYRLSISWPRIIPAGKGAVNPAGLDFYDRLINEILAVGITPWVTLFHWDYPYDLYCQGGWLNPDSPAWFAEYANLVARRLGDRVKHWMTLNEPQVFVNEGHAIGTHAPGDRLGYAQVVRAAYHSLLAHGKGVQSIRAECRDGLVGLALSSETIVPASDSKDDIEMARRCMFWADSDDLWCNSFWMDPIFLGKFPPEWLEHHENLLQPRVDGDLDLISQPVDFFCVNTYFGRVVRAGANGSPEFIAPPAGWPIALNHWHMLPEVLYWVPRFYYERYGKPVYITENGLSCMDWVALDGHVHDPQRIDFTQRYLLQVARSIRDGIDIRGYFHWSILDNFEWAEGYRQRFGLIHLDYLTQKRVLKDSAMWYREVIQSNGANL